MMKKVLILALVVIFAVVLTACGAEKTAEEDTPDTEVVKIEQNIDAVAEALGLEGKSETYYEMIGAKDGAEFNDGSVELYQYDPESKDYKDIEKGEGNIEAAACNNGFILVFPEGTDPDKKIVDLFNSLNF